MQLTPEEIAEQQKNEENTKKTYITPIIQERWGKENSDNIIMEYYFTDGRVNIDGDLVYAMNSSYAIHKKVKWQKEILLYIFLMTN